MATKTEWNNERNRLYYDCIDLLCFILSGRVGNNNVVYLTDDEYDRMIALIRRHRELH